MAAIAAGGKSINFDTGEVKPLKQKSGSSSKNKTTDTFDKSTGESYVIVQEKDSGDTVGYLVDGKIQKELPKKSSSSSKNKTITASNKGQTVETVMTDTRTGQTTRTVQDLDSGKTISKKIENTPKKIPNELQVESVTQQQFVNEGTQIKQEPIKIKQTKTGTISPGSNYITQEQIIRDKEYKSVGPVKKFFMKDWTEEQYNQRAVFDRSEGTDYNALLKEVGSGALANLQETGVAARMVYKNPYTAVEIVSNLNQAPKTLLSEAKASPGGFIGGIAVDLIGAKATNNVISPAYSTFKSASTKVDNVKFSSEVKTIETSPNSQGLGINQVVIKGQADITSGFVFKKTQTVDIEAYGILDKETKVSGPIAPNTFAMKENQLSTEFGATDVIYGNLDVKVNGRSRNVEVDIVRQGNKQISTVDSQTMFSETYKGPKMNDEQIFITESYNPYTKEGTYTLSKNKKSKPSMLPTDDIYASSSVSETQSFAKSEPIKNNFIDVESTIAVKNNKQLEYKSSDIKIINIEESKFNQPKYNNQNPQSQIFEEPIQKQKSSSLSASKQGDLSFNEQKFKTDIKPSNIEIPKSTIKDIYSNSKVPKIKPIPSYASSKPNMFNYSSDFRQQQSRQSPKQTPEIGITRLPAFEKAQIPVSDSSFKFDSDSKTKTKQRQDFENPTYPKPIQINPDIRMKTDVNFKFSFNIPKSKYSDKIKKQSTASAGEGVYVSSLGGLILDKRVKNPPKSLTGLELRGIKIK